METSSMFFLLFLLSLLSHSQSKTVVVGGLTEWRNPSVHVGDSLVFKHKHHYNLYIFHNIRAFNLCNFTQASLLNEPNSTSFTWHPSRPGFFYFSFNNGSLKACEEGGKLAIRVLTTPPENWALSPEFPPIAAPSPNSGGFVSSSPTYHWPFRSHQLSSPSPAPSAMAPATIPSVLPDTGGGIPFVNSNPAIPLPTGEADAATIRPLPTSAHGLQGDSVDWDFVADKKMVGLLAVQIPVCCAFWLL